MDPLVELLATWREEADVLEHHRHEDHAHLLRLYADQVQDALRRRETELVSVSVAAEISGYSEKHLRRLVREGQLRAKRPTGRRGRILIPRRALPRKPTAPTDDPAPAVERHFEKLQGRRQ